MKLIRGIFLFALLGVGYYGCTPDPVFPSVPALKFKEFRQPTGSDSLQVVFSFTDGDGDIGVAPNGEDTNMVLSVYAPSGSNGTFTVMPCPGPSCQPGDSLYYPYRIPKLTAGQAGLEGDIYVTIEHKSFIGRDTLQFNAFLLDQSHNRSNYVRTPTVYLTH